MKIKWGLKIFNASKARTPEGLEMAMRNTAPIFFDTVKDCFDYLGFKIPRVGHGYCGTKYIPGTHQYIEYLLTKYPA